MLKSISSGQSPRPLGGKHNPRDLTGFAIGEIRRRMQRGHSAETVARAFGITVEEVEELEILPAT